MRRDEILMIYGEDYQTMTKRLLCEAGLDTMIADKDASIGSNRIYWAPIRQRTEVLHIHRSLREL